VRFLVSPTRLTLERARPPVRLFLAFSLLLVAALVAQRFVQGELTPSGVVERYLGSGDPSEVMPLAALVESLHTLAFVYGFVWLMVGSLLVVSPVGARLRALLTYGGAAACAFDLASPFLVVWLNGWPWLRVGSFGLASATLFVAVVVLALRFGRWSEPTR
jgi:hypothetical protein